MKRTISYLVPIFSAIVLLFSSCLGDTNSRMSLENSISYVTTKDYAISYTDYGYTFVSSTFLNTLSPYNFYHLRFDLENPGNGGVQVANNMGYGTSGSYPIQEVSTFENENLTDYGTLGKNDDLGLTGFTPIYHIPSNLFNDKWIFQCTVYGYSEDLEVVRGDNNVQLNFVLQSNSQTNLNKDESVVEIYLTRAQPSVAIDRAKSKTSVSFLAVVDLSQMRYYFDNKLSGDYTSETSTIGYMQFQYYKYISNTSKFETTLTKVGAVSGSNAYGLIIGGKQPN